MPIRRRQDSFRVAIVGAGHAGLCVVGALKRRGIVPLVFDSSNRIGDTWRARYNGLVLNTHRYASKIPGVTMPPEVAVWPARDDWANYIEYAAEALKVELQTIRIKTIRHHPEGGWLLSYAPANSARSVPVPKRQRAQMEICNRWDVVVIATGRNRLPIVPDWPGMPDSPVEVLHSSLFRDPLSFLGRRVLVVGGGNSGTEIAHLLSRSGVDTTISIRQKPVFARREFFGMNLTAAAAVAKHFPDRIVDMGGRLNQLLIFGRLALYGIGPPDHRLSDVESASGATIDSGFVDDVKTGRIAVIDALKRFEGDEIVTFSGRRRRVDVVIAATGYTPALENLLPDDLLVDGWPRQKRPPFLQAAGLYTAGLNPASLTSFHPDFVAEAELIAADIVLTGGAK
jgi:putative flavoprotein involved in K+ transport